VSECGDAMSGRSRLGMQMSFLRVLEGLPRMLVPRQMLLLSVLLGSAMGMSGDIV